jgi:hypothetical protein
VDYKFSIAGKAADFTVAISMYYQTIAPRFVQDLFSHQTEKVAKFKSYYDHAEKYPILMKSISLNVTDTEIKEDEEALPEKFGLLRNYPNPFNLSTKICFQLSKSEHVILKVFDVLGNEIETLVDAYRLKGDYEINFDANNLSSGIYFYKLQHGEIIKTTKMLLLR